MLCGTMDRRWWFVLAVAAILLIALYLIARPT